MKKENVLVIGDCSEDDYKIYKKWYKKIARKAKIKYRNVFILTDKYFRQIKFVNSLKPIDTHNFTKNLYVRTFINTMLSDETVNVMFLCNWRKKNLVDYLAIDHTKVTYFGCNHDHFWNGYYKQYHHVYALVPCKDYCNDMVSVINYLKKEKGGK